MGPYWYELVRQLQGAADSERAQQLESRDVSKVLTKAVELARKDSDWNSSGLPESLQRALDLCDKQGPAAAVAAALRLLDFQQIVEAKNGNSPKGSPKQGQHFAVPLYMTFYLLSFCPTSANCYAGAKSESMTELHVPRSESQQVDSISRTSIPVITIKRSSEARATPTTTTIVLQPSLVQSNIAQRDEHQLAAHTQPDYTPHRQLWSAAKVGAVEPAKLHVLKSKNGRSNGSSLLVSNKQPPSTAATNPKPSCVVREAQSSQRQASPSEEATLSNSKPRPAAHAAQPGPSPMRAGLPPPGGASPSPPSETDHPKDHSGDEAGVTERRVNFSPFQAQEAQSPQLDSRNSNSDSDKSCESAGNFP